MKRGTLMSLSLALSFALASCGGEPDEQAYEEEEPQTEQMPAGQMGGEAAPPRGAEAGGGAVLRVDTLPGAGAYLTDGEGRALYLFTADTEGESRCYDACAEEWPPFLAPGGTLRVDAVPIQEELIGAIQRRTGEMQATYAGHPLYYYREDRAAGETKGQDVHQSGGEWYLVTPEGTPLESEGGEEGAGG